MTQDDHTPKATPGNEDDASPLQMDDWRASDAIPTSMLEDENPRIPRIRRFPGLRGARLSLLIGAIIAGFLVLLLQLRACSNEEEGLHALNPGDSEVTILVQQWIDAGKVSVEAPVQIPEELAGILKDLFDENRLVRVVQVGIVPTDMKISEEGFRSPALSPADIARLLKNGSPATVSPIEALAFAREAAQILGLKPQPALATRTRHSASTLLRSQFGILVHVADRVRYVDTWNPVVAPPSAGVVLAENQVVAYAHGFEAISLLINEDIDNASEKIRKALEQDESIAALWMLSGDIKEADEQVEFALADMRKAIDIAPDALGYYFLGMTYLRAEAYLKATRALQKATELDGAFAEPLFALSDLQIARLELVPREQNDAVLKEAEVYLENAIAIQANAKEIFPLRFQILSARGHADEAFEVLLSWVSTHPNDPEPHRILGQISLQMNDFEEARKHLSQAVHKDSEDPLSQRLLALALLSLNEWVEAEKALVWLLEREPENIEIRIELATAYFQQDQQDKAIALLEEQTERFPRDVQAPMLLTQIALNEGRFSDALSYARTSLIREEGVDGRILEFIALHAMKRTEEALAILDRKEKETPGYSRVMAEGLLASSEIEAMEVYLRHVLKADPQNIDLAVFLAVAYLITEREEEADALRRATIAAAPAARRDKIDDSFQEALIEVRHVLQEAENVE